MDPSKNGKNKDPIQQLIELQNKVSKQMITRSGSMELSEQFSNIDLASIAEKLHTLEEIKKICSFFLFNDNDDILKKVEVLMIFREVLSESIHGNLD